MDRIAFVREGGLGDILMTIPTVRVLSKKQRIDYYTDPKYFPLLRNTHCNVKPIQNFNASKYSKVYNLCNQLENYKLPLNKQHRVDAVAEYCKVEIEDKSIGYVPDLEVQSWAERFFDQFVPPKVVTIGLAWKSAFRLRSWPDMHAYQFCKLFDPLNYQIILLGENGDYRFSTSSIIDTCGYLSIEQTAVVIEKLDILVTNDNGLLHLGGNFEIPMIALFGSLPAEWRTKYYSKCRVVEADNLKCRPCMEWQDGIQKDIRHCIDVDVRCMSELKPLQIYYETTKYLEELKNERKIH